MHVRLKRIESHSRRSCYRFYNTKPPPPYIKNEQSRLSLYVLLGNIIKYVKALLKSTVQCTASVEQMSVIFKAVGAIMLTLTAYRKFSLLDTYIQ